MTNTLMTQYLRILAAAVKKAHAGKVVLAMDCHTTHVAKAPLQFLKKIGWKVLLIPGKMTHLLQPLDAYAFANFKKQLAKAHQQSRIRSEDGVQQFGEWADVCCKCIQEFFSESIAKTMFEKCGMILPSAHISERVLAHVVKDPVQVVSTLSAADLKYYTGLSGDTMQEELFSDQLPQSMQHALVCVRAPAHRMHGKRRLSNEEL